MTHSSAQPPADAPVDGNSLSNADLPDPPISLTMALLAFNGFLCAVLSVLFLPLWIDTVPLPVSVLVAAIVNVVLVAAARSVTGKVSAGLVPLGAWVAGYVLCMFGGPGGDVLLLATGRTLLLAVGGLLPPLAYMWLLSLKGTLGSVSGKVSAGSQ